MSFEVVCKVVLDRLRHPDRLTAIVTQDTQEVLPIVFLLLGPCAHLIDLKTVTVSKHASGSAAGAMLHKLPSSYQLEKTIL